MPASPDEAELDLVPNPHKDATYLVRFAAPEFTSLCPVTGQPDFAHLVIDYAPGEWLIELKSLKLYLGSFRNHGAFHEDCTLRVARDLVGGDETEMAAHRRLLVSARRHADRRLLADRRAAGRTMAAGPGRAALSRAGMRRRFFALRKARRRPPKAMGRPTIGSAVMARRMRRNRQAASNDGAPRQ